MQASNMLLRVLSMGLVSEDYLVHGYALQMGHRAVYEEDLLKAKPEHVKLLPEDFATANMVIALATTELRRSPSSRLRLWWLATRGSTGPSNTIIAGFASQVRWRMPSPTSRFSRDPRMRKAKALTFHRRKSRMRKHPLSNW